VAAAQGIPVEKLQALTSPATSAALDDLEKLVVAFAEALTRTPASVGDELFAALRARFDDAQLVELTHAIAWENFRARFNRAFLVESDGLAEGSMCLLPARATS
jgi:alkylhydroperoxidase family enzyme